MKLMPTISAETPQPAPLFDLSKDRFHDGLTHFVDRLPRLGPQFMLHRLFGRGSGRRRPGGFRYPLLMLLPFRRNVQIDPGNPLIYDVGFTPVTAIGAGI